MPASVRHRRLRTTTRVQWATRGFIAVVALAAGSLAANAQESAVSLWPTRAPGARGDSALDRPTITPFLAPAGKRNGTGVVIFPGGGYEHLSLDKEGAQVARWLNENGVSAFVVTYRLGPRYQHPAMMSDAQRAVRLVRANAARWMLNPQRIGVMGFSRGYATWRRRSEHTSMPSRRLVATPSTVSARDPTSWCWCTP